METISIDWLAVLVAVIVYNLLGAFWYSKLLFRKVWERESKKWRQSVGSKPKWYTYLGGFINAIIIAFFLALLIAFLGATSTLDGVYIGIGVWLGFVATTHFAGVLWANKPLGAYLIEQGYYLVAFALMGGIIAS